VIELTGASQHRNTAGNHLSVRPSAYDGVLE